MRVVIAKDYNRALARPLFNCPACFEKKEQSKQPLTTEVTTEVSDTSQSGGSV